VFLDIRDNEKDRLGLSPSNRSGKSTEKRYPWKLTRGAEHDKGKKAEKRRRLGAVGECVTLKVENLERQREPKAREKAGKHCRLQFHWRGGGATEE